MGWCVNPLRRLGLVVGVGLALSGGGVPDALAVTGKAVDPVPLLGSWGGAPPVSFERSLLARESLRPSSAGRIGRGSWWGGPTVTSTGETVTIYVSDSFAQDDSIRVSWANFFAWLYHGSELATVTIYQTTLDEVRQICGPEAAGCYSPSRRTLVFPGDVGAGADADIGAHEYGHHIAANRRNDPWDAIDWGPKHWASVIGVCSRVAAGTAFPGDEMNHYTLNTGEAFAEAYRILNIQRGGTWANFPLIVDSSFAPTPDSLSAALADVQQPWPGPTSATWDGRFTAPITPLNAAVGPRSSIALKTAGGVPAGALVAGSYAITVRDRSTTDDFHLSGPGGVDRRTGVVGRTRVVWTLELRPGTYRYRSDAHPQLNGAFIVAAPVTPVTFPPQERTITTPLDGSFQSTVTGTAGATLEVVDPASGKDVVGATSGPASSTICGQRSLLLRVAPSRPGTFHVIIQTP